MKALICGGRDFGHKDRMFAALDAIHERAPIHVVIEGGATGADRLAQEWATVNGIDVNEYPITPAAWAKHGKKAGFLRNQLMLNDGQPDIVIAFPGGVGTALMIRLAKEQGVHVSTMLPAKKGETI